LGLERDLDTIDLSAIVDELVEKVGNKSALVSGIPDVENAYVDVFIATKSEDSGGTCEFQLSTQNIAAINGLGLPVQFTVAVVKP
jgi:hypothetical protein